MTGFRHRGVVEGFYGTPFSHEDRLWLVDRLGAWGMNRYVYAPKDDPRHRDSWREPYPDAEMREFGALVARGAASGVDVGFAVSPGLSIEYASPVDRQALLDKLRCFQDIGARVFGLCLDDVPSELVHASDRAAFPTLARAHVSLAEEIYAGLEAPKLFWVVPMDYLGVASTDYLEELGAELDAGIEVGGTGRTTVSPDIRVAEARTRAAALGRAPLLWDNVPVADGPMRPMLHLAPYSGRDPALVTAISGALLNPMQWPRASAVTLFTAARFLSDPARYDPEHAWQEAVAELGAGAPEAFSSFAAAHRFSAMTPEDRDHELEELLQRLNAALAGGDPTSALASLRTALDARTTGVATLERSLADTRLLAEISPWIDSHAVETRRIVATLPFFSELARSDSTASEQTLAYVGMQGRLSRESLPARASYGPRRVLYPQLCSMRTESMGFGEDPALLTDLCLADDFVALADRMARERLGLR